MARKPAYTHPTSPRQAAVALQRDMARLSAERSERAALATDNESRWRDQEAAHCYSVVSYRLTGWLKMFQRR